MERRPHRPGGFLFRRLNKNQESAIRAEEELKDFQKGTGKPSEAFFSTQPKSEIIVFVSPSYSEAVSPLRFQLERFFRLR